MSADVSLAIGDRGLRWFLLAFALTQLVEVPIYARALRVSERAPSSSSPSPSPLSSPLPSPLSSPSPSSPARRPLAARVVIAFGASALTHPIVWFVMPWLATSLLVVLARAGLPLGVTTRTLVYGALAEGFALLVEAAYLRAFGLRRAFAWSLAANVASVIVGTAVVACFG